MSIYIPDPDPDTVFVITALYEQETEEQAVAEDEAAFGDPTRTLIEVPRELLPAIRELIAKHQSSRKQ